MEEKIWKALKKVIDPELGVNIVDLGLVYKIEIKKEFAKVLMTLTSPGCPLFYVFEEDINKRLLRIKGVKNVRIKVTFNPVWTPDRVSKKVKLELGMA